MQEVNKLSVWMAVAEMMKRKALLKSLGES